MLGVPGRGGRGGGRQAEGPEKGSNAVGQAGSPRREAVGIPSRSACWRGRGAPAETVRGVEGLRAGHPTLEPHTRRQQFVSRTHSRFGGEGHPPARGPPAAARRSSAILPGLRGPPGRHQTRSGVSLSREDGIGSVK